MGDFSRSRNSKIMGIIKLKLTYLVPAFISLLLSQFQRAPLDITLPVGKMETLETAPRRPPERTREKSLKNDNTPFAWPSNQGFLGVCKAR